MPSVTAQGQAAALFETSRPKPEAPAPTLQGGRVAAAADAQLAAKVGAPASEAAGTISSSQGQGSAAERGGSSGYRSGSETSDGGGVAA